MAKLYFYYSAMNAGKTTTLLQSSYNYRERGMNTIIFTPAIDNRYEVGYVTSRIGLSEAAVVFDHDFDFFNFCQNKLTQQPIQCIFIDEGHFLTKQQVKQLAHVADQLSIPVLAYGLRSDFQGETFEGSQYLLAWAEILSEIKTICYCGSKATMNMRIDDNCHKITEGNQVEIGGNERYISVCRKHFYNHNPSMINTAEEIEHDNCEH